MKTSKDGIVVGVVLFSALDPDNVSSYRTDDTGLAIKHSFLSAIQATTANTIKTRSVFTGKRAANTPLNAEEAEAVRIDLLRTALERSTAWVPSDSPASKHAGLAAQLALLFSHTRVQEALSQNVLVDGKSIATQLDAVAVWCANTAMEAVRRAGGFADAAAADVARASLTRRALIAELPLPLLHSSGLNALLSYYTADFKCVMGKADADAIATQFIAVLPDTVRSAVRAEDTRLAMAGKDTIAKRLVDPTSAGATMAWLTFQLPALPPPPAVGGIEGHPRAQRRGGDGAAQQQRDKDFACGACFHCHIVGHMRNNCPTLLGK
jgi:hypothetical protein